MVYIIYKSPLKHNYGVGEANAAAHIGPYVPVVKPRVAIQIDTHEIYAILDNSSRGGNSVAQPAAQQALPVIGPAFTCIKFRSKIVIYIF